MLERFLSAKEEPEVLKGLLDYQRELNDTRLQVRDPMMKNLTDRITRINIMVPGLEPGVIMALAQSNASDDQVRAAGRNVVFTKAAMEDQESDLNNNKKRSLWDRAYGGLKTGLRFAFAAGETIASPFDMVGGSLFDVSRGNQWEWDLKNPLREGWWASTPLGTMLMEGGKSGEGFGIGGEAAQNRARRLGDYAGWMPLTTEAGAGVNTQFDADPQQVAELARQLVDQQGLDYDDALLIARAQIRSQLKVPFQFFETVAPQALPAMATMGLTKYGPLKNLDLQFEDMGSPEFITVGAVTKLATFFALPDPTAVAVGKGIGGLRSYYRGRQLVDEAGNFIIDFSNAAATTDEAIFLADADYMTVASGRFEAAGLDLQDAAVETLTPQPGTWYHGSTGGVIDEFVPLSPETPSSMGNLYGPGLYTSENAVVSQSAGYQPPDSTMLLTDVEQGLLGEKLPQGVPTYTTKAAPQAGTLYRFSERTDVPSSLANVNQPFPADKIEPFIDALNGLSESRLTSAIDKITQKPDIKDAFETVGLGDIFNNIQTFYSRAITLDNVKNIFRDDGGDWWKAIEQNRTLLEMSNVAKDAFKNLELPPSQYLGFKRAIRTMVDFVAENGRFPSTADEVVDFLGGQDEFAKLVSAKGTYAAGDFVDKSISYINIGEEIPKGFVVDLNPIYSRKKVQAIRPVIPYDTYHASWLRAKYNSAGMLNADELDQLNFFNQAKVRPTKKLVDAFTKMIDDSKDKSWINPFQFNASPANSYRGLRPDRIDALNLYGLFDDVARPVAMVGDVFTQGTINPSLQSIQKELLERARIIYNEGLPIKDDLLSLEIRAKVNDVTRLPGVRQENVINPLTINMALKQIGFDGIEHTAGGRLGGGQLMHQVRIWFDPTKNLDITDPLTGEAMPLNTAIRQLKESGEYAKTADELREQAEELRVMAEMGASKGAAYSVDGTKLRNFFTVSRQGKWVGDQVWDIVKREDDTKWYDLWDAFKGRLPLEALNELAGATSRGDVTEILSRRSGWTPGVANLDDINLSTNATLGRARVASRIDGIMDKVDSTMGKFYGRSPESIRLEIFGSERQKLDALRNLDAFLQTGARVDDAVRKGIVAKFTRALASGERPNIFDAQRDVADAIRARILAETGDTTQASIAADLFNRSMEEASGGGLFDINAEGLRTDNNYAALLAANPENLDVLPVEMVEMLHGGPGLLTELIRNPLELPDVLKLRRATSFLGYFTGQQGFQRFMKKSDMRRKFVKNLGWDLSEKDLEKIGELRIPIRAVDFAMNTVWKNMKKFSLAYAARNNMEAQATMYLHGDLNMFNHPVDYLSVASHAKLPDDLLLGEAYNPGGWRNIGQVMENAGEGYRDFLTRGFLGTDQRLDMVISEIRGNGFEIVSKEKPFKWAQAASYELGKLARDPISSRFAKGMTVDEVMAWLYSGDEVSKKSLSQIESLMRDGELFLGGSNPRFGNIGKQIPVEPTVENVRIRVQALHESRLQAKTAGDAGLMEVVSSQTINGAEAFKNGKPTQELLDYLQGQINNDMLPNIYLGKNTSAPIFQKRRNWFDKMVSTYFDNWVGFEVNVLDRSPLWRLYYSQEVNRLAPLLSKESAQELLDIYNVRVAHYDDMRRGFTIDTPSGEKTLKFPGKYTLQDYVGPEVDADELVASLNGANGGLTREQLHIIANSLTLDRLQGYLFDAAARNSITDAARVAAPFGAAWAETTRRWTMMLAKNPENVARATRNVAIAGNVNALEPYKNRGLIHKDEQTGEFFYSLPFSYGIASLLANQIGRDTGARYGFEAPVKGLNMALNFVPGVGPAVGYPLGKLLYGSPKLRDIATFFMPYGPAKSPLSPQEYLPGWLSKVVSAFADADKQVGVYGDTLDDVIRAELATGKWNISDPIERQQFFEDAGSKAKLLTILRGIGQGLGPSSPQLRAKIRTESGEVYAGFLQSEFHRLQDEDYETAIPRFLAAFGDDAFAYMQGKTREVVGGVEANREFAEWQLENADLFDSSFREVAGYFGPKGSTFDWAIWNYQQEQNQRERIPPIPVQVELAEQTIGMSYYRSWVMAAGPKPTKQQRIILAAKKAEYEKEFPGMLSQSTYDVEKFDRQIDQLRTAVGDPRLADNEIAAAVSDYLDKRDFYMAALANGGRAWGSTTDEFSILARASLNFDGAMIAQQTPGFARVFDRLLSREVEK